MKNKKYTFEELINRLPNELIDSLKNSLQDPIWHPEGSVYVHTKQVFEYAQKNFSEDVDLLLCAIFHDLGKPETQTIKARNKKFKGDPLTLPLEKQKISNIGHDKKAKFYIEKYFNLFSDVSTNKEKVLEICDNHLRAHMYISNEMRKPFKRNKIESLKYFKELLQFEECDSNGNSNNSIKNKRNLLIKLSEYDFFNEKYFCVKNEDTKLKLKNSIMNFLELFYKKDLNKNIYTILDSMNFENFYKNLMLKYKINERFSISLSNQIFKYCQKLMSD